MPQNIGKEKKGSLRQIYFKRKPRGQGSPGEALFDVLLRGSMTLEAALIFPLFLFSAAALLSLFLMMQTEYAVENALNRAVSDTALLGEMPEQRVKNLTKAAFYKELVGQNCPLSLVQGKAAGFSWKGTKVDNAYLDAKVIYRLKLPINFFGKHTMQVTAACRMHRWTGKIQEGQGENQEEWVYVTPNQSVYHKSRECTHLKLSVTAVWAVQLKQGAYHPCGHCTRGQKKGAVVYVTDEGGCYHYQAGCSGLKRTLYMVKKSQIPEKRPCSRCR